MLELNLDKNYPRIRYEVIKTPDDWLAWDVLYFTLDEKGRAFEAGHGFIDKKHPKFFGIVECPNCKHRPIPVDARLGICTSCGWQSIFAREY